MSHLLPPLGAPASEEGYFRVDVDGRGLALLYARRTFASDPYEIVLHRFDPASPADDVRVVATGITTLGYALARAGEGQWLAAYTRRTATTSSMFGDPNATTARIYARFIYDGTGGH